MITEKKKKQATQDELTDVFKFHVWLKKRKEKRIKWEKNNIGFNLIVTMKRDCREKASPLLERGKQNKNNKLSTVDLKEHNQEGWGKKKKSNTRKSDF